MTDRQEPTAEQLVIRAAQKREDELIDKLELASRNEDELVDKVDALLEACEWAERLIRMTYQSLGADALPKIAHWTWPEGADYLKGVAAKARGEGHELPG